MFISKLIVYKTKILLTFCLVLCVTLALYALHHRLTDGFSVKNIRSDRALAVVHSPECAKQEEIHAAFSQDYYYLGKGVQCWAFVSADGQYVLKFFKIQRFRTPAWLELFPLNRLLKDYREKQQAVIKDKYVRNFESLRLGAEHFAEESGLLFLHLLPMPSLVKTTAFRAGYNDRLNPSLILHDKLGWRHEIDLNQSEFMLQRKVELVRPAITRLMKEGRTVEAQQRLSSLVQLLIQRCQQGIGDSDPSLLRNAGFLPDGDPIIIDIGRFFNDEQLKEPSCYKKELQQAARRLLPWLKAHYPELAEQFEHEIDRGSSKTPPKEN